MYTYHGYRTNTHTHIFQKHYINNIPFLRRYTHSAKTHHFFSSVALRRTKRFKNFTHFFLFAINYKFCTNTHTQMPPPSHIAFSSLFKVVQTQRSYLLEQFPVLKWLQIRKKNAQSKKNQINWNWSLNTKDWPQSNIIIIMYQFYVFFCSLIVLES